MKVLGIYAQGAYDPTAGDKEWLEPLGLEYVLGQASKLGHTVDFLSLYDMTEDELVSRAFRACPDVIAMSAMTCQVSTTIRIAKACKEKLPEVKIVLGGYHPSAIKDMPEMVDKSTVDYWVVGEGEITFVEILQALEAGVDPLSINIPGLALFENGGVSVVPRKRVCNLDQFGEPWRPMSLVKNLKNYGLVYPAPSAQRGCATIEYSRGCLGTCPFCSSVGVLGSCVTFRSPEVVCAEIKRLYEEEGINGLFLCDLDFIQRGKENQTRSENLCRRLKELGLPVFWEAMGGIQSILGTGNFHLLDLASEAKCCKLGWGLETLDARNARSMHKGHKGSSSEGPRSVLKYAEDRGILNTAFLIIGWHDFETGIGDTRASIEASLELLLEYPVHRIRVAVGTPLPGSHFYRVCRERGLITDLNLEHYDTNHLVYAHPSLSVDEVQKLRDWMYREFYCSTQYERRMSEMLDKHPEYANLFEEFLTGLRRRGYA